ncbi:MAG: outer membrane protein assembly factor BamE [Pseudomonadota bacterium]
MRISNFQSLRPLILLLALTMASSGCVYRLTVQQGNLVDQEKVDQIETGMTRKQVRFLLGTPMIDDPFNKDRWDYLYRITPGRRDTVGRRWITVFFENDAVAKIERGTKVEDISDDTSAEDTES